MNVSKYNVIFPYGIGKYIYFNTLTENLLLLDKKLWELIQSYASSGVEKLENVHPDLYIALKTNGFIVEKNIDEYKLSIDKINKYNERKDMFHLIVNPTMDCNFACWYCYEEHIRGSKMSNECLQKVKRLISKLVEKQDIKKIVLAFFGGEPLLYFSDVVEPLIKYVSSLVKDYDKELQIQITSNGYLIDKKIVNLLSQYKSSMQITLDGNQSNHDNVRFCKESTKKGTYATIVNNIIELVKHNVDVTLRLNCTKDNIVSFDDIFDSFKILTRKMRKKILFSMGRVWQDKCNILAKGADVNLEHKAREFGFSLLPDAMYNHVKCSCYADKQNQVVVNYNGDIYKCNARKFNETNKEGFLDSSGYIEWNERHKYKKKSRFRNIPCKTCFAFPVCGGGCSQTCMNFDGKEYCIYDFNDSLKREYVYTIVKKSQYIQE